MKSLSFSLFAISAFAFFAFFPFGNNSSVPLTHAQATNIGIRVVAAQTLDIRSAPQTGNNVIGHYNHGDRIMVIEKDASGYWCRVDYQNLSNAWVACPYLVTEANFAPPTPTTALHGAATGNATVNTAGLNIRSWAGMGNNVIGSLRQGDVVSINGTDSSGFWCNITYGNNQTGWAACSYMTSGVTGLRGAAPGNATVNTTGLNVRSWAGVASNNIIGSLRLGDGVTVLGTDSSGGWCNINYGNRTGWVACRYLNR